MKAAFQRRIDRYFGTPLCLFFSLVNYFPINKSSHLHKPKKILVILLSETGSLVLAKPMFDHLKATHPSAILYILIFKKNEEIAQLLNLTPNKNILVVRDTTLPGFFIDSIRALRKLRRSAVDTALDCELFSRVSSIFSFLSGAKLRAGFFPFNQEGLYRGSFINRRLLYNPYIHISKQFVSLAESIERDTVPAGKRQIAPEPGAVSPISVDEDEFGKWKLRFEDDFPNIAGSKLILFHPSGGLLPIRAWPLDNYCAVAKDLIDDGYTVGILGFQSDKKLANAILAFCEHGKCVDLTGYTKSVRELLYIFHYAVLLVANDGGPGHIAALTRIPSIIIYGPETPALYAPLSENAFTFYSIFSCSPCLTAYNHRNTPCDGDNQCLKGISAAKVLEQAREILRRSGA